MKIEKEKEKMSVAHKVKPVKIAELYPREYGMAAYQAWLRREAEITELAKTRRHTIREICRMREDSFRQMKAEGARWAAQSAPAAHVAVKPTRAVRTRVAA